MRGVLIVLVVVMLVVAGGYTGVASATPVGTLYPYVSKVHIKGDSYLYINVNGNFGDHGCGRTSFYVRSKDTLATDQTKAWMQMAMASFLSQSLIFVQTDGCSVDGVPIMINMQLQDAP